LHQIGVLSLQGAFALHEKKLSTLNAKSQQIRRASELQNCDALIIPGGESTTILKLIDQYQLRDALIDFATVKPVFGTCAGAIVLSNASDKLDEAVLDIIDIHVARNAYGRQVDSFIDKVQFNGQSLEAVFIRAPKIIRTGNGTSILALHQKDPVLVKQRNILVATFHPELTDDLSVHRYFLDMIDRATD
jgi:5'-phosphate synthase pdxT subunit